MGNTFSAAFVAGRSRRNGDFMEITNKKIDAGKAFDWGRTSEDYAKYRDIYPQKFYDRILDRKLCLNGQNVLDLGTGTGVLPRNMYRYGAHWTGIDISENQIKQAQRLSKEQNMDIKYAVAPTEEVNYADNSFDVITACQCFWYFDHDRIKANLARMLKPDGKLLILYMAWLPFEDKIAGESERLALKYNSKWSGCGETKHPIEIPDVLLDTFEPVYHEEYNIQVPFTRESWHGRMKACRGIGASLSAQELEDWEQEHKKLLEEIATEKFKVLHYAALAELKLKSSWK